MTNEEIIKRLESIATAELVCDGLKVGAITKEAFEAIQETARLAIAALSRDRWISVEERLPDKPGDYLVIENYWGVATRIRVRSYTDDLSSVERYAFPPKTHKRSGWYEYDSEYGYFETGKDITHWMPLPEPPKEDKP